MSNKDSKKDHPLQGKMNRKKYVYDAGCSKPRIYYRKKDKGGRYLIKCGCCEEIIEIYYGNDGDPFLEINGVIATKETWKEIFIPLLEDGYGK